MTDILNRDRICKDSGFITVHNGPRAPFGGFASRLVFQAEKEQNSDFSDRVNHMRREREGGRFTLSPAEDVT